MSKPHVLKEKLEQNFGLVLFFLFLFLFFFFFFFFATRRLQA